MGFIHNLLKRGDIVNELKSKIEGLEKTLQGDYLLGMGNGDLVAYDMGQGSYYNSNYIINRSINLLSNNIAALPLKLYRGEQELPHDFTFPNGFSLSRPNTGMSLNELLYITCVYYFFKGEFCQQIVTDDGIMRLVPLNPKRLTRDKNGNWKLDNKIYILKEDLIYTAFLNPEASTWAANNSRGLSPVDVVKAELKNDKAAGKYSTKFFENFTQIGGILTDKDGNITPEAMDRLVTEFNVAHQSQSKAYKTLGLPKGITYEDVSQTMREMEFLSSRKDIRDKILIVLGLHKALVGITETVNRSVSEEAGRQMWSQTLKPAAIRIQEKYNQQLLNIHFPGYYVKFDFSEVQELQENMESILKQAVEYKKLGYTTNEINAHFKLGMEDIVEPEGNQRFVPVYLRTLDQLMMTTEPSKTEPAKPAPNKAIMALIKSKEKKTDKAATLTSYRQVYLRKKKLLETKFTSKIKRYFFEQRKEVLKIVNEAKHSHNITNNLNPFFTKENERLKKVVLPLFTEGAELGITLAGTQIKSKDQFEGTIDEDVLASRANEIRNLALTSAANIVRINSTVYNKIKLDVFEGLKEGETITQMATRIKGTYNMADKRSVTIARTESGGIVNESTFNEYNKKGVSKIIWIGGTRFGDGTNHRDSNGTIINRGEEFPLTGLHFPGDQGGSNSCAANLINCTCCIASADNLE